MNANTSTNAYALIHGPVIFESSSQEQFNEFEKSFPAGTNALKLITEPAIFEPHVQKIIDLYYAAIKN
jgi:hypothetical protein